MVVRKLTRHSVPRGQSDRQADGLGDTGSGGSGAFDRHLWHRYTAGTFAGGTTRVAPHAHWIWT
jgi:hypothetical protein